METPAEEVREMFCQLYGVNLQRKNGDGQLDEQSRLRLRLQACELEDEIVRRTGLTGGEIHSRLLVMERQGVEEAIYGLIIRA